MISNISNIILIIKKIDRTTMAIYFSETRAATANASATHDETAAYEKNET